MYQLEAPHKSTNNVISYRIKSENVSPLKCASRHKDECQNGEKNVLIRTLPNFWYWLNESNKQCKRMDTRAQISSRTDYEKDQKTDGSVISTKLANNTISH